MISDRDKLVVAKIWQELTKIYGIQHRMSTANHHTTAEQVERMNHEIITYLRFYVNWQQDNWVEILPMAQMVINNRQNRAIGMSPYEAVYGKEPRQQDWREIENGQYSKSN
jgi:hypothetical protein